MTRVLPDSYLAHVVAMTVRVYASTIVDKKAFQASLVQDAASLEENPGWLAEFLESANGALIRSVNTQRLLQARMKLEQFQVLGTRFFDGTQKDPDAPVQHVFLAGLYEYPDWQVWLVERALRLKAMQLDTNFRTVAFDEVCQFLQASNPDLGADDARTRAETHFEATIWNRVDHLVEHSGIDPLAWLAKQTLT